MKEKLRKNLTWGSMIIYAVAERLIGERMTYPGLIALSAVGIALSIVYSMTNKISKKRLWAEIVIDSIMLGVIVYSGFRMVRGA